MSDQYGAPADHRPVDEIDGGARRQAINTQTCILGHPVTREMFDTFSAAGKREFNQSGMCEPCFDKAFADPTEDWPIFSASSVAEYRTPEALAAEAASTTETYGNACYFGGGDVTALEVNFLIQHDRSCTEETSCQACLDRVLGAMVKQSLDNARESGYVFGVNSAEDLAMDIARYDGGLDQVPAKVLLPFVQKWLEAPSAD